MPLRPGSPMPSLEGATQTYNAEGFAPSTLAGSPALVDNAHAVTAAFQNRFVPAFFLFDAAGNLYFGAAGEKGLQNLGPKLEQLLA